MRHIKVGDWIKRGGNVNAANEYGSWDTYYKVVEVDNINVFIEFDGEPYKYDINCNWIFKSERKNKMKKCVSLHDLKDNRFDGKLTDETVYWFSAVSDFYKDIRDETVAVTISDWKKMYALLAADIVEVRSDNKDGVKSYLSKLASTMMYLRDLIEEKNSEASVIREDHTRNFFQYSELNLDGKVRMIEGKTIHTILEFQSNNIAIEFYPKWLYHDTLNSDIEIGNNQTLVVNYVLWKVTSWASFGVYVCKF